MLFSYTKTMKWSGNLVVHNPFFTTCSLDINQQVTFTHLSSRHSHTYIETYNHFSSMDLCFHNTLKKQVEIVTKTR